MFIGYLDISEPPFGACEAGEQPAEDLARRRAARERLTRLTAVMDSSLPCLLLGVARDSQSRLEGREVDQIAAAVDEIERLLGDTAQRRGRWSDLRRHLRFGQGHDWHDIAEFD